MISWVKSRVVALLSVLTGRRPNALLSLPTFEAVEAKRASVLSRHTTADLVCPPAHRLLGRHSTHIVKPGPVSSKKWEYTLTANQGQLLCDVASYVGLPKEVVVTRALQDYAANLSNREAFDAHNDKVAANAEKYLDVEKVDYGLSL